MTGQCRTLATPHLHVNPRACAFPVAFTPDPSRTSQPHQRTLVLHPALVTLHTLPRFPAFNRSFGVPSFATLVRCLDPATASTLPSCRRAVVPSCHRAAICLCRVAPERRQPGVLRVADRNGLGHRVCPQRRRVSQSDYRQSSVPIPSLTATACERASDESRYHISGALCNTLTPSLGSTGPVLARTVQPTRTPTHPRTHLRPPTRATASGWSSRSGGPSTRSSWPWGSRRTRCGRGAGSSTRGRRYTATGCSTCRTRTRAT